MLPLCSSNNGFGMGGGGVAADAVATGHLVNGRDEPGPHSVFAASVPCTDWHNFQGPLQQELDNRTHAGMPSSWMVLPQQTGILGPFCCEFTKVRTSLMGGGGAAALLAARPATWSGVTGGGGVPATPSGGLGGGGAPAAARVVVPCEPIGGGASPWPLPDSLLLMPTLAASRAVGAFLPHHLAALGEAARRPQRGSSFLASRLARGASPWPLPDSLLLMPTLAASRAVGAFLPHHLAALGEAARRRSKGRRSLRADWRRGRRLGPFRICHC